MQTQSFHTSYMETLFREPEKIVRRLRNLQERGVEFDTIVGTGISGLIPLKQAADELGIHWLAVRKPGENSHSGSLLTGEIGDKWLMVDDFMQSGATVKRVVEAITRAGVKSQFVGLLQYEAPDWDEGNAFATPIYIAKRLRDFGYESDVIFEASEPKEDKDRKEKKKNERIRFKEKGAYRPTGSFPQSRNGDPTQTYDSSFEYLLGAYERGLEIRS